MKVKRPGSKKRIPQAVSDDVVRGFIQYVYSQNFFRRARFCIAVLLKKRTVKIG